MVNNKCRLAFYYNNTGSVSGSMRSESGWIKSKKFRLFIFSGSMGIPFKCVCVKIFSLYIFEK